MKILITGHTGFKGSWLSMLLHEMGHELYGYSLPPTHNSLYSLAGLSKCYQSEMFEDIRKEESIANYVTSVAPQFIIHFAAQPLVRYSYLFPKETFTVNVNGTLNVLQVSQFTDSVEGILIITTDKVYRNSDLRVPFKETDALGGVDPYSSSKAMADLLAQSWMRFGIKKRIMIARAGNVIGGGDYSTDRLIPDLVASIKSGTVPNLRSPIAVRPWQHVLDCLNGYIHIMSSAKNHQSDIWNVGPNHEDYRSVRDVANEFLAYFSNCEWTEKSDTNFYEAGFLTLNSNKLINELNWRNLMNFEQSIAETAIWYRDVMKGRSALKVSLTQVKEFLGKI